MARDPPTRWLSFILGHRPDHWDGLPDGHTRATSVEARDLLHPDLSSGLEPLSVVLTRRHANITVATRPLTNYVVRAANAGTETS